MGQMRFYAPTPDALLPHAPAQAYLAGIEGVPWPSCNRWTEGVLCLERSVAESGSLHIPWEVPGLGQLVLSTCTLMERAEPYHLATEIARGTLHRARMLVADLEAAEVPVPPAIAEQLKRALSAFLRAATVPAGAAADARTAIHLASRAIAELCEDVVLQQIYLHRSARGPLPSLLAGPVAETPLAPAQARSFLDAFQAVSLAMRWRDLQPTQEVTHFERCDAQLAWCREHGLRVLAGPLIQADRRSLPDWIYRCENRYDAFEDAARRHVRSLVRHYDEAVDVWICAGRLNVPGALNFSEEQRLRLAVAMIEVVRDASSQTPVVIGFDQPWAEYLSTEDQDLSPLHFADALVRAELGIGAIALEINLGYWPGGCLPRDLLAISRHLDRWSLIGLPLIVYLTMPSSGEPDAQAEGPSRVVPRYAENASPPAMDQSLARHLVPLLLTKPALHAVVWNQWSDAQPHEFPHSGLLDQSGQAKPLLAQLSDMRRKLLT